MLVKKAYELVGNTPLIELTNIEKALNLKAKIFAKVELFNPAGSIKDRIALSMIEDAENKAICWFGFKLWYSCLDGCRIGLVSNRKHLASRGFL